MLLSERSLFMSMMSKFKWSSLRAFRQHKLDSSEKSMFLLFATVPHIFPGHLVPQDPAPDFFIDNMWSAWTSLIWLQWFATRCSTSLRYSERSVMRTPTHGCVKEISSKQLLTTGNQTNHEKNKELHICRTVFVSGTNDCRMVCQTNLVVSDIVAASTLTDDLFNSAQQHKLHFPEPEG